MNEQPDASILLVSYNTKELIQECLTDLLEKTKNVNREIILVDNGSSDGTSELISSHYPSVKLITHSTNIGFGAANNLGLQAATGRYIVLLNSDAFLHEGALEAAIAKMDANKKVGIGGARLVGKEGEWQPSARQFPSCTNEFLKLSGLASKYPHSRFFGRADYTWCPPEMPQEVDWVTGAFGIIPHDLLKEIGFFDERFFMYYEEVDLCKRIKEKGYQVWYWPDIVVTHLDGETTKHTKEHYFDPAAKETTIWRMYSMMLYFRKHHGSLGAHSIKLLEQWWSQLRVWKHTLFSKNQTKAQQSQATIALLQKAWKNTNKGKDSPKRPW